MNREDADAYDSHGLWTVSFATPETLSSSTSLRRVVYSSGEFAHAEELRAKFGADGPVVLAVAPSTWKGVIKNVSGSLVDAFPGEYDSEASRAQAIGSSHVVTVSLRSSSLSLAPPPGPVLVLQCLRYRGNVGAILRTAVQANMFSEVVVIDPVYEEGAKNNDRIPDSDVYYYR